MPRPSAARPCRWPWRPNSGSRSSRGRAGWRRRGPACEWSVETAFALLTIARLEGAIHGKAQGSGVGFRVIAARSEWTEETTFALLTVEPRGARARDCGRRGQKRHGAPGGVGGRGRVWRPRRSCRSRPWPRCAATPWRPRRSWRMRTTAGARSYWLTWSATAARPTGRCKRLSSLRLQTWPCQALTTATLTCPCRRRSSLRQLTCLRRAL